MAGPGDLYDLCREALLGANAALVASPGGAIDRAYVSPGPPAFDCCPQLTVHAGSGAEGATLPGSPAMMPGQRVSTTGAVNLIALVITVLRCVPVASQTKPVPDAAAIDAAAVLTNGDLWSIWHGMRRAYQAGTLFTGECKREFFWDAALPILSQGGCAGWQINIRVQLDGYA